MKCKQCCCFFTQNHITIGAITLNEYVIRETVKTNIVVKLECCVKRSHKVSDQIVGCQ